MSTITQDARHRFETGSMRWTSAVAGPEPVSIAEAVEALKTLCQRPGAPRWAATGWATSLAGRRRDRPRLAEPDQLDGGDQMLAGLVDDLRPAPVTVTWPGWMSGREDDLLLDLGVSQGKPGRVLTVDIPAVAAHLVVDLGDGLVRFRSPQWSGSPLTSDARLLAVAALVAHAGSGPEIAAAARNLVRWVAGPGRADVGRWARSEDLSESRTAAAAMAYKEMYNATVDAVTAAVLHPAAGAVRVGAR